MKFEVIFAVAYSAAVLLAGYLSLGFWTMLILTSGFVGGLILWLIFPDPVEFARVKWPFWSAFALFVVHRIEEYVSGFFGRLADITGAATPEVASIPVIAMVLLSIGGWLAAPLLAARKMRIGTYFLWTFFCAMGVTELAHLVVFPFFTDTPIAYFPGMASVIFLAPVAWWGMARMAVGARKTAV